MHGQVQKATGLAVVLGAYGLPTVECRRWAMQEADAQAILSAPEEAIPVAATPTTVTTKASTVTQETGIVSAGGDEQQQEVSAGQQEVKDKENASVTELKDDSPAETKSVNASAAALKEFTERALTRVTLEADRYLTFVMHNMPLVFLPVLV